MAGEALTTTAYAVMALLSFAPMSGYELARAADRSISRFWPISKPKVYSELRRLEADGLVAGTEVVQDKLPDKRVFQLTPAGDRVLDAWLSSPELEPSRFRIPFVVRTLVGHRITVERMRELLLQYARVADDERVALRAMDERLEATPDAFFARATVLFGEKLSAAIVEWAQEVESMLPDEQIRIDPRRREPDNALRLLESLPEPRAAPVIR